MVALATAITGREIVSLILAAGALVWIVRTPPDAFRRRGTVAEAGSTILLLQILGFFAYAGTFVFGSGLAIVPFLHGGVVLQHRWRTERQFLDAVAVALIRCRNHGGRNRGHRRSSDRSGPAVAGGRHDRSHCSGGVRVHLAEMEDSRAGDHCRSGVDRSGGPGLRVT